MIVLLLLALAAPVAAAPNPLLLPDGTLVLALDGARYTVTPARRVVPVDGVLSYYGQDQEPLEPVLDHPTGLAQGYPLPVLVASMDPLDSVRALLRTPAGFAASATRAFELPYIAAPTGVPSLPPSEVVGPLPVAPRAHAYALLLAVPAEASLGAWRLEVEGVSGDRSFSYAAAITVSSGGYTESRIRLTRELTTLRTRSDARTARDQARLDAALRSFRPDPPDRLESWGAPAGGVRSAGFGDRRLYLYSDGSTARSVHRGTDLALPTGTPVRATAGGRVVLAEALVVTGNTVAIESFPGVVTLFYHLSAIHVSEGDTVVQGQVVGRVGATGLATGPHLHWELRVAQVAVVPATGGSLVDKRAVFRIIAACESKYRQRR